MDIGRAICSWRGVWVVGVAVVGRGYRESK